eukprot:GHVT01047957.1.p1 GENE.GHVT01047957.1~~GHVT01047957.1.p1  ORF type:complete len:157 (+),score=6.18 GHVT01047957.1:45-515(+)
MPPTFETSVTVGLRPISNHQSSPQLANSPSSPTKMSGDATMAVKPGRASSNPDGRSLRMEKAFLWEFFHKEPSLYSHTVFQHAAEVFEALSKDPNEVRKEARSTAKPTRGASSRPPERTNTIELPVIDFETENDKRLTFTLVFQTLKCKYFMISQL